MSDDAARTSRQVGSDGRWFPRYLALMGVLAFAFILVVEVLFPTGTARNVALGVWAAAWIVLGWWGASHDVRPRGGGRLAAIAIAVWFGTYLFVIGPVVRWLAAGSVWWWSLAALVMAAPFFVASWYARRIS